jgi:hypothetical protein
MMGLLPYLSLTTHRRGRRRGALGTSVAAAAVGLGLGLSLIFLHINSGRCEFFIDIYIGTLWLFIFFCNSNMLVTYKYI